jgi:hypothetical protein
MAWFYFEIQSAASDIDGRSGGGFDKSPADTSGSFHRFGIQVVEPPSNRAVLERQRGGPSTEMPPFRDRNISAQPEHEVELLFRPGQRNHLFHPIVFASCTRYRPTPPAAA